MAFLVLLFLIFACLGPAQDNAQTLLREAQANLNDGHYSNAIRLATSAADQFRRSGDQAGLIRALTDVGLGQLYSGDYPPALKTFTDARDLSKRVNDREYEITSLSNIGTIRHLTGRYSEAMDAYRDAAALADSAAPAPWLASRRQLVVANTAILYQTLGQYDRALALYNRLLDSKQALAPREQAQLLANMGVLRRRLGILKRRSPLTAKHRLYTVRLGIAMERFQS